MRFIEQSVAEYRESLDASLSHVVDEFMDGIFVQASSKYDPFIAPELHMQVIFGRNFYAGSDTEKRDQDTEQE